MTNYVRYSLNLVNGFQINLFFPTIILLFIIGLGPTNAKPVPNSFSDLVETLSPTVVNITSS